jgi:hypothetical protein
MHHQVYQGCEPLNYYPIIDPHIRCSMDPLCRIVKSSRSYLRIILAAPDSNNSNRHHSRNCRWINLPIRKDRNGV